MGDETRILPILRIIPFRDVNTPKECACDVPSYENSNSSMKITIGPTSGTAHLEVEY